MEEALGNEVPQALQQFRSIDFDCSESRFNFDLGDLVETHTYIQETKRGGLGVVDFFLGSVKTEVTEHNFDKERFKALVEKAIEETFREIKLELRGRLGDLKRAGEAEMGRVIQAAKDAASQQAKIQQQDKAECQRQLLDNKRHTCRMEELKLTHDLLSSLVQRDGLQFQSSEPSDETALG